MRAQLDALAALLAVRRALSVLEDVEVEEVCAVLVSENSEVVQLQEVGGDPNTRLEFCPWLLPEFVLTGHEVLRGSNVEVPERHRRYFDLVLANPDIFPGFFHFDLQGNVLPKLELLRKFGFYLQPELAAEADCEGCGAQSAKVE